jgi:methionyl aminopeptidase
MVFTKSAAEIELMRETALMVGKAHAKLAALIRPGITTRELDQAAESFIVEQKGVPSFKNYNGYPFASCISVNDAVVHGFPGDTVINEGDIISVDLGVFKNGYHGDSAYTYAVGNVPEEYLQLLKVTKESLYHGIEKAVAGNRVGDIGFAIQEHTERRHKYGVVRELVGHGVGRRLHEDPQVPNYGKRGSGAKLKEGTCIAIEPMINLGVKEVFYDTDGWTVRTKDGKVSAHFEHTVCVMKNKADILSSFEEVEKAEKANAALNSSYY